MSRLRYPDDPYVQRAGWARDALIAAGMSSQVRVITKAAGEAAGNDHAVYRAFVVEKIKACLVARAARSLIEVEHDSLRLVLAAHAEDSIAVFMAELEAAQAPGKEG